MWWNRVIRRLISSIPGTAGEPGDYTFLDVAPGAYQASVAADALDANAYDHPLFVGLPIWIFLNAQKAFSKLVNVRVGTFVGHACFSVKHCVRLRIITVLH